MGRAYRPRQPRLERDEEGTIVVYTNCACKHNGKPNAHAGYGVYWVDNHPNNRHGALYDYHTNNRAELQAVLTAMDIAIRKNYQRLTIRTGSKYVINCSDDCIDTWPYNGWLTMKNRPVANKVLWEEFLELYPKIQLNWEYAPRDDPGIIEAKRLANLGADEALQNNYCSDSGSSYDSYYNY